MIDASVKRFHCPKCSRDILAPYLITKCPDCGFDLLDVQYIITEDEKGGEYTVRIKRQEEQIKNRDESLEKAREEIKWLRRMLKEQEVEIRQLRLALDIVKGTCKGIAFETDEKFMGDL